MRSLIWILICLGLIIGCKKEPTQNESKPISKEPDKPEASMLYVFARTGLNIRSEPKYKSALLKTIPFCSHVFVSERSEHVDSIDDKKGHWVKVRYSHANGPDILGWAFEPYLQGNLPEISLTLTILIQFQAGRIPISEDEDRHRCREIRFHRGQKFTMVFNCHSWADGSWQRTGKGLKAELKEGRAACQHLESNGPPCTDFSKSPNTKYEFLLSDSGLWSFRRTESSAPYPDDFFSTTKWQELGKMTCIEE